MELKKPTTFEEHVSDHFVEVNKIVPLDSGAERKLNDYARGSAYSSKKYSTARTGRA